MKKQLSFAVLLCLLFPAVLFAGSDYDRVYVFGDSLSDTGNLASITGDFPQPPYYQNRVSNGRVAVEIMAARLGLPLDASMHLLGMNKGTNYAVAAASAARSEIIDLSSQVAQFLANHGGVAPDDALYVMFIGGNDVRKARDIADWNQAEQHVLEAANVVGTQMQVLTASGARHWLVINAPDIGRIPETRMLAQYSGMLELPGRATALTILYNAALKAQAQLLQEEAEIEVKRFDLFKLFGRILDKGDKLGFTNTTDPCFSSEAQAFQPGCRFGANFDRYIYFDEIHPTARVHALVGEALYLKVRAEESEKEVESADD